jgi:hypothetical protein
MTPSTAPPPPPPPLRGFESTPPAWLAKANEAAAAMGEAASDGLAAAGVDLDLSGLF